MRRAALCLLLCTAPLVAQGGRGGRGARGQQLPLPGDPVVPDRSGNVPHDWLVWWGWNRYLSLDFRARQRERAGPITGADGKEVDLDAWRSALRARVIPLFTKALSDPDREVRAAAAVALGKLRASAAAPALEDLYRTTSQQDVREAALQGLLLMGDPGVRRFLIAVASTIDEQRRLRGFALLGLGRIGDTPSRAFLLSFFDPRNKLARAMLPSSTGDRREFRVAALAGLLLTGDKGLAGEFRRIARDKRYDEDVRAYAVTCLGKLGVGDALDDVLRMLARNGSNQVRRSAALAAGLLAGPNDLKVARKVEKAMRSDKDKIVRHFATISLGRIGGDWAVTRLLKRYERANREERGFILLALGYARHKAGLELLRHELTTAADASVRACAAVAFGLYGDPAQAEPIRAALDTKNPLLRMTAMLTLGMLNDTLAAGRIRELLLEKDPGLRLSAAVAYALLRQHHAVPLFIQQLKESGNVQTQMGFTQVMGYLPSVRAAAAVEEIYKDPGLQRQVRAQAVTALGTLADDADFPAISTLAFDTNYFIACDALATAVLIR